MFVKTIISSTTTISSEAGQIQDLEKSLQLVIRQFSEERRILQEKHAYVVAEIKADNMVSLSVCFNSYFLINSIVENWSRNSHKCTKECPITP